MAEAHEDRFTPDGTARGARLRLPPVPEPARRLGRLWTALALLALLALGIWLGRLQGGGEAAVPVPTSAPPRVITVPPPTPKSCLDALHLGDATIALLVHGVRDRRLADTLKSYVTASKACREEVSSR